MYKTKQANPFVFFFFVIILDLFLTLELRLNVRTDFIEKEKTES